MLVSTWAPSWKAWASVQVCWVFTSPYNPQPAFTPCETLHRVIALSKASDLSGTRQVCV